MAQETCVSRLPPIGETQPPVLAWPSWVGGCAGNTATFPANVDANILYTNQYGIGANDIDAMWIPPNVVSTLSNNGSGVGGNTQIHIDGTHTAGGGINYPGLYQFEQNVYDIYGGGGYIGINDVDVVSNRTTQPWSDYLYSCCANPSADVRLCGAYKPGAAVCSSRLLTCTGDKLKTDEGCQNMCRSDPITCDKIKRKFCDANPNDKWCSCMNVEQNPDFIALENKIIQKTGQSPRLACSPFGRCMTGTDLLDIYLPKNIMDDRTNVCPSYSAYLDQSVTTSGTGNVVNTTQTGTAGGNAGSGASIGLQGTTTGGNNNIVNTDLSLNSSPIITGISNQTLFLIIGFVLLVVAALWFFTSGSEPQPMYGMYGMPPPMMMGPPMGTPPPQMMQPQMQPMPPPMMMYPPSQ